MRHLALLLSFLCTAASAQSVSDLHPLAPAEADSPRILVVDLASSQGIVPPSSLLMEPLSLEAEQSTAVSILKGTAMVVGGTALGVGVAVLGFETIDEDKFNFHHGFSGFPVTLVAYPLATASGVYLMGRVLGEDGSFLGALAASAVTAGIGATMVAAASGSTVGGIGFLLYVVGSPIGALVGFHTGPALLPSANGDVVPGAKFQIQF